MKDLDTQLKNLYIGFFFSGMIFFYGIEQLFIEQIGDGNFIRGVATAVFTVVLAAANIPSGALSDIWGRVVSIRLAFFIQAISLVILGLSDNVWTYAIGAGLFALYWSFQAGAREAFIYDLLVDNHKKEMFERVIGKLYALILIGAAFANLLSGILTNLTSLRAVYFISLIPSFLGIFFVSRLVEPKHHRQIGKKVFRQLDDGLMYLRHHKLMLELVVAQIMILAVAVLVNEFAQVAIVEHTSSPLILGVVWAGFALVMAFADKYAHLIKRSYIFASAAVFALITYYVFHNLFISVIALALSAAIFEALLVKGEGSIQEVAPKNIRATLSSIPDTTATLIVSPLAVWIGASEGSLAWRLSVSSIPIAIFTAMLLRAAYLKRLAANI